MTKKKDIEKTSKQVRAEVKIKNKRKKREEDKDEKSFVSNIIYDFDSM